MKRLAAFGLLGMVATLVGCNDAPIVTDVPNPERVERKPYDQMSKEEKIQFIQRTPMSDQAKQKQIDAIRQGKG